MGLRLFTLMAVAWEGHCVTSASQGMLWSAEDCRQTTCLDLIEGSPAALASADPQDMPVALAANQAL